LLNLVMYSTFSKLYWPPTLSVVLHFTSGKLLLVVHCSLGCPHHFGQHVV